MWLSGRGYLLSNLRGGFHILLRHNDRLSGASADVDPRAQPAARPDHWLTKPETSSAAGGWAGPGAPASGATGYAAEPPQPLSRAHTSERGAVLLVGHEVDEGLVLGRAPERPKAAKSAASQAARSSTRGSGWAPSGPASYPLYGSAELPRAARCALRRRGTPSFGRCLRRAL